MIPIKLSIKGLYSYQEEQTIDFTQLTDARLFGVFGGVGAGKSSILDAMTLALFDQTERMGKVEQGAEYKRDYNLLNLSSNELSVRFEFQKEEQRYLFTTYKRRNRNKFQEISKTEKKAYKWKQEEENWEPIAESTQVNTKAQEILGMNYLNFRRTVVIPQGKFQEFLQLGQTERTRMLKEIFNLHKYELGQKTGTLEKENNAKLQVNQGKRSGLEGVNKEIIADLEEEVKKGKSEREKQEINLKELQARQQILAQIKQQKEQLAKEQAQLVQLKNQAPSFETRKNQLLEYEQCQQQFKPLLEQLEEVETTLKKWQQELEKHQQNSEKLTLELTQQTAIWQGLQNTYHNPAHLVQQIGDLKNITNIHFYQEKLQKNQQEELKIQTQLQAINEEQKPLKEQLVQQEQQFQDLKQQLIDPTILGEIRNWHTQQQNLQQQIQQKGQQIQEFEASKQALPQKRDALIKGVKLPTAYDLAGLEFKTLIPKIQTYQTALEEKAEQLGQQLLHLQTQHQLQEYANTLHDGEACPLCGATEHPHILNATDVQGSLVALQKEQQTLKITQKAFTNLTQKLGILMSDYKNEVQRAKVIQADKAKLETQLQQHLAAFVWKDYDPQNIKQVEEGLSNYKSQKKQLDQVEIAIQKSQATLKTLQESQQTTEKEEGLLLQHKTKLQGQIETLSEQIQVLQLSDFEKESVQTLKAKVDTWNTDLQQFQQLETKLQDLKEQQKIVAVKLESTQQHIKELKGKHSQTQERINTALSNAPFSDLNAIQQVLKNNLNIKVERAAINTFEKELHTLDNLVKTLSTQLAGKKVEEAEWEQLMTKIQQLSGDIKALDRQIGGWEKELNKLGDDLAKLIALEREQKLLAARAENITTLKKLFKASGFVNYVSTIYLRELCNAANVRFQQLTRRQLSIEVSENNNIIIRDFLNGGQTRSAKTLSGGQTFQASLCLALALADRVQQSATGEEDFFFLDEGFGSLDKQSLGTVFDTLKSLRQEKRIVGVISHVEELQQEIDVYLSIKNEDNGSVITPSWE